MPAQDSPKHVDDPSTTPPAHDVEWDRIAASAPFRSLVRDKIRWIVPATIFFVAFYFALPILVGWAPRLMATKVFGQVNLAYLFALAQFVMAWGVAALYVRAANRFDARAKAIVDDAGEGDR